MQFDMDIRTNSGRVSGTTFLRPRLKTLALYTLIFGGMALILANTPRDFSLTLQQVRPVPGLQR